MKYYSMNLGDFAALTQGLSTLEIGVIVRVRHMVLGAEKPVPGNRLALVLRDVPKETLQAVLNAFFAETEAGWTAPDLEQIIADFHATAEKNRQAGIASGKKRSAVKAGGQRQTVADQSINRCSAEMNDRLTTVQRPFNKCLTGVERAFNENERAFATINHKPINHKPINHKPEGGVGEGPQASPPPADASPSAHLNADSPKRLMPDVGHSPMPGATMTTGPVAPIAPRPEAEPQDASAGVATSSSEPAKPKKRIRTKPKIELPYTALPDEWRTIGDSIDPDLDYRKVFREFREYWLSEGKTMRDWTRVWRNRVRDLQSYPNAKLRYGRDPQATPREQLEELAAAKARGEIYWSPPPVSKPAPEQQDEEVLRALDNMMSGFTIRGRRAT